MAKPIPWALSADGRAQAHWQALTRRALRRASTMADALVMHRVIAAVLAVGYDIEREAEAEQDQKLADLAERLRRAALDELA